MTEPDMIASHGSAWLARLSEEEAAAAPATIALWLAHIPGAHPVWSMYALALVSLKDFPNVPRALKQYPKAEYELVVLALDPGFKPNPAEPALWMSSRLEPPNLIAQFHGTGDKGASRVLTALIDAFCSGRLSPDTDHATCQLAMLAETVAAIKNGAEVGN